MNSDGIYKLFDDEIKSNSFVASYRFIRILLFFVIGFTGLWLLGILLLYYYFGLTEIFYTFGIMSLFCIIWMVNVFYLYHHKLIIKKRMAFAKLIKSIMDNDAVERHRWGEEILNVIDKSDSDDNIYVYGEFYFYFLEMIINNAGSKREI